MPYRKAQHIRISLLLVAADAPLTTTTLILQEKGLGLAHRKRRTLGIVH